TRPVGVALGLIVGVPGPALGTSTGVPGPAPGLAACPGLLSSIRTPGSALGLAMLLGSHISIGVSPLPFVLASYHRNRTLTALAQGGHICFYFGFAMSFFGLATMLILFAMALERCLALGRPYFYERFLSPRTGLVALPAIYTFSAAFCSLPLVGFGRYVQYCPGTWCFIQMHLDYLQDNGGRKVSGLDVTFSLLYATLLLFLILSVLLCNLSVITRRMEIDHLLLLSIMTITFVICSLPFTVSVTASSLGWEDNHDWDLLALRFLSINSIVDPWVFAILRPPVLRFMRSALCCQVTPTSQDRRTLSPAKTKLAAQLDPCGPFLLVCFPERSPRSFWAEGSVQAGVWVATVAASTPLCPQGRRGREQCIPKYSLLFGRLVA
uniref:Prostaglandin E receptor 2 n=1 Tax=Athene cunicularia TaxID=194338 RepID=A0A663LQU9_ATHCN